MKQLYLGQAGHTKQRQGKFESGQENIQPYLLQTIFGTSIAQPNSIVYVKLGKEYFKKPVEELKAGENVLFSKEGIPDITIDKVEEALAKSVRYAATQPVLFQQLPDKTYAAAFGCALLNGITADPEKWPGVFPERATVSLEAVLGMDREQVLTAAEIIHAKLEEQGVPAVSLTHIQYGWLGRKVIAPRNKQEVVPALIPLAPSLSSLMTEAFESAYELYVTVRRTVMREVSLMLRGTGGMKRNEEDGMEEKENEEVSRTAISTKPEIKMVVDHFASDISRRYIAAQVLEVRPMKRTEEAETERMKGELFKGVVTGEVEDPEIRIKPLCTIMRERSVLTPIWARIFYEFLRRENSELQFIDETGSNTPMKNMLLSYILGRLGASEGLEFQLNMRRRMESAGITRLDEFWPRKYEENDYRREIANKIVGNLAERFMERLYSGKLDAVYNLPVGTLAACFEYYVNLEKASPQEVKYKLYLLNSIRAKQVREKETGHAISMKAENDELEKLRKRVRKRYGVDLDRTDIEIQTASVLFSSRLSRVYDLATKLDEYVYSGKLTPREAVERTKKSVILADDEIALAVLREMGFGNLEFLYPKADEHVQPYFDPSKSRPADQVASKFGMDWRPKDR